jgi:hypothetical protein
MNCPYIYALKVDNQTLFQRMIGIPACLTSEARGSNDRQECLSSKGWLYERGDPADRPYDLSADDLFPLVKRPHMLADIRYLVRFDPRE